MGYYKCIRCGGTDTYTSQENGRTFAVTLDTPSAVDPTLLNTLKESVNRCRKCGEKCKYVGDSFDRRRWAKFQINLGWVLLSFFLVSASVRLFVTGFSSSFGDFATLIAIPAAAANILIGRAQLRKLDLANKEPNR